MEMHIFYISLFYWGMYAKTKTKKHGYNLLAILTRRCVINMQLESLGVNKCVDTYNKINQMPKLFWCHRTGGNQVRIL